MACYQGQKQENAFASDIKVQIYCIRMDLFSWSWNSLALSYCNMKQQTYIIPTLLQM